VGEPVNDAVVFRGVRKEYGRVVAVDRVDLAIGRGTFVGLLGHNGAGKSTCLEMLVGLVEPTEGTILVDGIDITRDPLAARRRFGAVLEEPAVFEWLTAREFLEFVAEVRGSGDLQRGLQIADLGADADRPIHEYSQGMRRRTALAAAMMTKPLVLVLDEALNGLDPHASTRIKEALREHVQDGGTVLLSTHVLETVQRVADRVVVLSKGRVLADARAAKLGEEGLERLFAAPAD
jgi:ABC-2 type transport system ATP-binding protein